MVLPQIIIIIIIVLRFALGRAGPSTALCTGEKPYYSIREAEPPYAQSRVKKPIPMLPPLFRVVCCVLG